MRMRDADVAGLARIIMEQGGSGRDEGWYRQAVENRTSSGPVALERAVTLRIRA